MLATEKIHAKVKSVINIITCYIVVGDRCYVYVHNAEERGKKKQKKKAHKNNLNDD